MVGEDWGAGSRSSSGPLGLTQYQTSPSPAPSTSLLSHSFIRQHLIFMPIAPLKLHWQKSQMLFYYQIQWPFSQLAFFKKFGTLSYSLCGILFSFGLGSPKHTWSSSSFPYHFCSLALMSSSFTCLLNVEFPGVPSLALSSYSPRKPILSHESAAIPKTVIPKLTE